MAKATTKMYRAECYSGGGYVNEVEVIGETELQYKIGPRRFAPKHEVFATPEEAARKVRRHMVELIEFEERMLKSSRETLAKLEARYGLKPSLVSAVEAQAVCSSCGDPVVMAGVNCDGCVPEGC